MVTYCNGCLGNLGVKNRIEIRKIKNTLFINSYCIIHTRVKPHRQADKKECQRVANEDYKSVQSDVGKNKLYEPYVYTQQQSKKEANFTQLFFLSMSVTVCKFGEMHSDFI